MLFDVTSAGITLSTVPLELMGRVSSCMAFLTQGVKPLGALAGGVLGTTLGLHMALWVAAIRASDDDDALDRLLPLATPTHVKAPARGASSSDAVLNTAFHKGANVRT